MQLTLLSAMSSFSWHPALFLFLTLVRLRPQIVLVMQSRTTRSSSHSPPNHRGLPTVAEETPPGASPASSWVESAFVFCFFFLGQFFSFYFFKDKCPTALSSSTSDHPMPPFTCFTLSPPLFVHPSTFRFYPFFLLKQTKKTVKSTLCISAPPVFFPNQLIL